ncbi:unnamed protein product [Vicia faba]|uniref:beta-galactosidase n=1 Tax=Vicia faba TaxID=3906 RepID=A0AAV1AES6_VICFA|nr:unnamed protein product [Vicia faba]
MSSRLESASHKLVITKEILGFLNLGWVAGLLPFHPDLLGLVQHFLLLFLMWPDLIQKSKDGGIDVIETYVFWNLHEPVRRQDKQNEVLMETYRSMLHELQKLQVEEEMIMRKLYEVMSVHGLTKQNEDNSNASNNSAGAEQINNEVNTTHEDQ